ncbi:ABC transporter ATP-binding protein [Thomasclavelia cocleata]|jgi:ABC-type polysaccharide/polyol phosphate transport system ATPase subunit|uniref:ABC transporter ATP-binding protein n=1 Tax=Thomasclavelia cocleata TaxID=69824 RepID=UPI00241FEFEC|nr:ABC transporter ATP-binding protein [Thomasclavelia cocleata]MCI9629478.1 ABC transporter ATP-binding protein [Thomasclavelia cocleata]
MENKNNAIEVRNLYKKFKVQYDKPNTMKESIIQAFKKKEIEYHQVLKNINIDIKKGETIALIGTNGSGKSTLLKLMTKILYPDQGTLETNGKLTSLLELGAGFHPDFTGRENIYFNASIFGLSRKDIDKRIEDIINFSELEEFIDNPVRTYSSGMYMRLAFSIAINVDADILLIDEILAVGDQHFQEKCFEKLKELRDTDKTIVIVSHSLNTVKELCTRAIWLYKGEFRLDGDPAYVISEYLKQQRDAYKKGEIKKEDLEIHTKAVMFIEKPKSFEMISGDINKIRIEGWEITDNPGAQLKVFVDDVEQNSIFRKPRNDVYETYKDEYPNLDVEEIGWTVDIENNFIEGEHLIKVRLTDIDDIDIVEKEVKFSITKNRRL